MSAIGSPDTPACLAYIAFFCFFLHCSAVKERVRQAYSLDPSPVRAMKRENIDVTLHQLGPAKERSINLILRQ